MKLFKLIFGRGKVNMRLKRTHLFKQYFCTWGICFWCRVSSRIRIGLCLFSYVVLKHQQVHFKKWRHFGIFGPFWVQNLRYRSEIRYGLNLINYNEVFYHIPVSRLSISLIFWYCAHLENPKFWPFSLGKQMTCTCCRLLQSMCRVFYVAHHLRTALLSNVWKFIGSTILLTKTRL